MKVTPKTEEEIQTMGLLPPGRYEIEVLDASDRISKNGNEMIEIHLKIWDQNGKVWLLTDYLMDAMSYKLRHFCEATNLIEKYNAGGIFAADCLDKYGEAQIAIQKGSEKDDGSGERYRDKNVVRDYYVKKGALMRDKKSENDSFLNDQIPF